MYQSEQINELAQALSKFQGKVDAIVKNKTANTGKYSYSYADLGGIWEIIRKPLMEHGLAIMQTFVKDEGRSFHLLTTLVHNSGQWIKSTLPLNFTFGKPQELGSEITYLRRYALSSILGLSTEDDDDGAIAQNAEGSKGAKVKKEEKSVNFEIPAIISPAQAKELSEILNQCDPDYRKKVLDTLKNAKPAIEALEKLPANLYDRFKTAALKNKEEWHKTRYSEFDKFKGQYEN